MTLCLINEQRAAAGAAPVAFNPQLFLAGKAHAADMVAKSYFSHTSASGADPEARALGAGYALAADLLGLGEVLAWGSGTQATPRQIVASWMASTAHRTTMLDPYYREAGIGVVAGAPSPTAAPARRRSRASSAAAPRARRRRPRPPATRRRRPRQKTRLVTKKRCRWVKRTGHKKRKTCRKVRVRVPV